MRIVIHDYAGHPFQVQLSRELARRGNKIHHLYFGSNNTPKGDIYINHDDPTTLSIEGVFTKEPIQKYSFVKRWLQDLEYGSLVTRQIENYSPDVVLSANTPLDAQKKILRECHKNGIKFVFWLQDISSIAAKKLLAQKVPIAGSIIGQYHIFLERSLLLSSDHVVLIAEEFTPILESWGIDHERVSVIPNWAPLENIPVKPKANSWSIAQGLSEKFCVLYTGGLGMKHNPRLLLELALHYRNKKSITIVVVSEGLGASWLQEQKAIYSLENLKIFDYQPFDQMPNVLATGDILVAILQADAGEFSVPSKVLSYLCAERPLLLAVPQNNLASKIVVEYETGLVVPPDNPQSFINAADSIYGNGKQRDVYARNGRKYAENNFDIKVIADRFEYVLSNL